jgi:hypothetical protein
MAKLKRRRAFSGKYAVEAAPVLEFVISMVRDANQ